MLQVQLIGNIGKDAELKDTNGNKFISFSVGTNEKFKDQDGNKVEKTTWVSCILSKDSAVKDFLKKGTKVFVEGDLSVKCYKNSEGNYQAAVNCRVRRIELLSAKREDGTETGEVSNGSTGNGPEDDLEF